MKGEGPNNGLRNRVDRLDARIGEALKGDFEWRHLAACPGHLGLLLMTAAKHGRPIVADSETRHGPEVAVARETGQPFINWAHDEEVDRFFQRAFAGDLPLGPLGLALAEYVRNHYTLERSVQAFLSFL